VILGVIRGLAEYFNISVFWSRFIAVLILIFTGFWPVVGLYLLAALLLKPEPVTPLKNPDESEFYSSYTASRKMALDRLKRTYTNLDRRLRRLEDNVTAREFEWDQRLNKES
jgi:phage shock protein C